MIKFFTFLASFVFFANFQAQETESFLPKGLTQEEKSLIKDYSFVSNLRTPPPTYLKSLAACAPGHFDRASSILWRNRHR